MLANEHAAVYVYGVLGARTSESGAPELYRRSGRRTTPTALRRDLLTGQIAADGATPVPSATAYEVPTGLETRRRGRRRRAGAASAPAPRCTPGRWRARRPSVAPWQSTALNDAAVRALGLRGTPEMFPGADEYADR